MYYDLHEVYWWNDIMRDNIEFVTYFLNAQQVKVEHQRSGGMTQIISIPTWEWK